MNNLVGSVRPTAGIGVVGVFLPLDPGASDALAEEGTIAFDLDSFWFKGQSVGTGQANVEAHNRQLARLVYTGKATPSFIVSHRLHLQEAPDAYKHFDDGWTKMTLRPAA